MDRSQLYPSVQIQQRHKTRRGNNSVNLDYSSPFDNDNTKSMNKMSNSEIKSNGLNTVIIMLGIGLGLLVLLLTSSIILNVMMGKALISAQSSSFKVDAFRKTFYNSLFKGIQSNPDLKKSFDDLARDVDVDVNTDNIKPDDGGDNKKNDIFHYKPSSSSTSKGTGGNNEIIEYVEHDDMLSKGDKILIHYIANSIVQMQHLLYKSSETIKYIEEFKKVNGFDVSTVVNIENIEKIHALFTMAENLGKNTNNLLNDVNRGKVNEILDIASELAPQATNVVDTIKNITGKADEFLQKLINGKQDVKLTLK